VKLLEVGTPLETRTNRPKNMEHTLNAAKVSSLNLNNVGNAFVLAVIGDMEQDGIVKKQTLTTPGSAAKWKNNPVLVAFDRLYGPYEPGKQAVRANQILGWLRASGYITISAAKRSEVVLATTEMGKAEYLMIVRVPPPLAVS